MVVLNDPLGYEQDRHEHDNWTPARGLRRGIVRGSIATALIICVLAPLAVYFPYVLSAWLPRTGIAFVVAWILFGVVQRAAGMAGAPLTALAVTLTITVLLSHHLIFALHGVPTTSATVSGWQAFHPLTVLFMNAGPVAAVGVCAALRHRGDGGLGAASDILSRFSTRPG